MVLDNGRSGIEDLPIEIQLQILDYLKFDSRCIASEVCRLWNSLAFSGRFMNRICLRLEMTEANAKEIVATLNASVRNYRHIAVDFNDQPVAMMDHLANAIGENDALERLTLRGMNRVEPVQLLILLDSVPHLKRLYLIGTKEELLYETNFQARMIESSSQNPPWTSALSTDSPVKLQSLEKLHLLTSGKVSYSSKFFIRKFPNITQLYLSSQQPCNAALLSDYKNQLETLSLSTPSNLFVVAFCSISFPKLRNLYLDQMELHDQLVVAQCMNFFKNRVHAGRLQQLILHPKFMMRTAIFSTICDNCGALQVLKLSLDYMDGDALKDVTNLQQLQNLSLYGTAYFRESPHWPYQIGTLRTVQISASRFPISLLEFIADIAPNLENLKMEDVENPEELFRILPGLLEKIRLLELSYSKQFERPPSCHPSGLLRSMHTMESFHLQRVIIKHGIQGWLQDAPQLKEVALTDCSTLTDTHLVILTTNCPKLDRLKLTRCSNVTVNGIEEFHSRVPLCRIDVN
ncbi:uncharacterized protein LOC134214174 [Armigeres subalbatus]|uniref:uncharacterized protein LOC134214174 n=1 Tax=Armigeres subalbatus TaxID=124917 RepID=UPI002ED5E071